ncbi:MAG TPA: DUF4439 domain-containing protein [Ornithinibacter sp.]|nr:DUF4439 domain-containing protein [Ornithinibacter sp.]
MTQGARPGVPRRTVMVGLVAAVLPASGCGIRLEDDAPAVPLVPTRTPVPAEAELVALTRDTASLADLAEAVPGAVAADLATLHRRQYSVLRTTLLSAQVPAADLDTPAPAGTPSTAGPTNPTGTPSASGAAPSSPPVVGRSELAEAEGASAAAAATFAGVEPSLRATMASLHAQRYAAATLLAGRPPTVPLDPVAGNRVAALATSTSAAGYFLEVVAARSTGRQRARADATLAALRDLRADQLAGGAIADASLGHPLPFPVEDSADAARLARQALTSLRAGYGEHLEPLVTSDGGAGLAALTRWLGAVEVEAHRWGVDLAPFPGLA